MEINLVLIVLTGIVFLFGMAFEHVINEKRWKRWKNFIGQTFEFWDNPEDEVWNKHSQGISKKII